MLKSVSRLSALVAGTCLVVVLGVQADEPSATGSTVREPEVQVSIALAGELDTYLPPEIDLEGLSFTSHPPSGLTILVR